ncbi:hypothetical protein [Pseudomonas sp.]|uniref:hypothetical protein n=1 Tax=Pseudomonas sp. TaxID=306 RepID=UPI003264274E
MDIYRQQFFSQSMPGPVVQPLAQQPVKATEQQLSDIPSSAARPSLRSNAGVTPTSLGMTTDTSILDKVSDPKLEIKKESTSPNGLFSVKYALDAPSPGLSNITFPMIIDEGLQRKSAMDGGIYYAMVFGLNTEKGTHLARGYIGMQPRGDGKALIIFSGYGPNFKAPQGRAEFDGTTGASNSTLVDFKFGNKYNLSVERDPADPQILRAFIQDVTNVDNPGPKQHLKDLHVDQKVALAGSETGFVEQYGAKINRSSQIAATEGSFFAPFTTDDKGDVKVGTIKSEGLYGRYKNSIVGKQQVVGEPGKAKEIKFSLQGAAV